LKGIILAGGTGSRLEPCTKVTNKHLLPVYNKPMIYYPLFTLLNAGIKEILIVSGPEHSGHILNLLGSGKKFNAKLTYEIQDVPLGIANALYLGEDFADRQPVAVILGDNIFQDSIKKYAEAFNENCQGAVIFLKKVPDPERFGVPVFKNKKIISIEEKPLKPKSSYAVTGLYFYDSKVFDIIKELKPSKRGEYEISDVNNSYLNKGKLDFHIMRGFWSDAGTFQSLYRASTLVREYEEKLAIGGNHKARNQ